MSLFYRLMGIVAAICAKSSRFRVNAIPSHLWIVAVCVGALAIGADLQRRDAPVYNKPPVRLDVARAISAGARNEYITVTGAVAPDINIQSSGDWSKDTWYLLCDPASHQGLLVKQGASDPVPSGHKVTVTGMLRSIPSDLSSHLRNEGFTLGVYSVAEDFQLEAGEGPVNPQSYYITIAVAGLPLILILISVLMKHTIFIQSGSGFSWARPSEDTGTPPSSVDMRYTGALSLGTKIGRRFLDVPAAPGKNESGELAFCSNINASITNTFGVMSNRSGLWVAAVKPGSLVIGPEGSLYIGINVRPAIRVSFTDVSRAKPRQASVVLSFGSEEERRFVKKELEIPGRANAAVSS